MSGGDSTRARRRSATGRVRRALPVDARDGPWLALALLPGLVAVAVYLATNPYPAYGAGLYAKIAEEIAANGYAPPVRVPGYTADGVPFAYPPLQFYVFAVLLDLGLDPVSVSRWLPSVGVVAALVPIYLLGRDAADSRPAGAAAAALAALNPQVLEWHISAGGVVRAFAFLYATIAVYAGYRIFVAGASAGAGAADPVDSAGASGETGASRETRERPAYGAVALGVVAFGLTVLSHPTYSLFVVASYLVFWVVGDRSLRGFVSGLAVGVGGALVASPWLAWVVAAHGPDVFGAAAGTHGGVGGGVDALFGGISAGVAAALVAAAYLAYRRAFLLPAWLVVAVLLFEQPRFAYAVAAVLVPVVGVALVRRRVPTSAGGRGARSVDADGGTNADAGPDAAGGTTAGAGAVGSDADADLDTDDGLDRRAAIAAALVLAWTAVGGAYFAYEATLATDPTTPEFLDDEAVEAMEWVAAETDSDATFVVLGDAAEWFPALTDRTILVGPWGVEWVDAETYDRQFAAYVNASRCQSAECVERFAADADARPTHVYVPKGHYTIRGDSAAQFGTLERSFERSGRWELVYENEGVAIYGRVANESSAGG